MPTTTFLEAARTLTLAGTHVVLEPLAAAHAAPWSEAANDDRTTFELTHVPQSPAEALVVIRHLLDERDRGLAVPFSTINLETGAIVGATRFLTLRWWNEREHPHAVEIGGTWLAPSVQRTAVNTEAKYLMLCHAFEVWGVDRVDLKTDARNSRSRRSIERLGAVFEGVLRNWQPSLAVGEEGRPRDSAMYSITAAEWPPCRRQLEAWLNR